MTSTGTLMSPLTVRRFCLTLQVSTGRFNWKFYLINRLWFWFWFCFQVCLFVVCFLLFLLLLLFCFLFVSFCCYCLFYFIFLCGGMKYIFEKLILLSFQRHIVLGGYIGKQMLHCYLNDAHKLLAKDSHSTSMYR